MAANTRTLGFCSCGLAAVGIVLPTLLYAEDWAQFRGPNATGVAAESTNPPVEFSAEHNVRWSLNLGKGVACPIVADGRCYVTEMTAAGKFAVLGLDAVAAINTRYVTQAPKTANVNASTPVVSHPQKPLVITDFDDAGGPFDCCNEERVWRSKAIPCSGIAEFLLSANIECTEIGEFEPEDHIALSYRVDGGVWTPLFTLQGDFRRSTFSAPLVAGGNKVQLKIEARTSSSDETYKVHQLSLKAAVGSQSPSFPPEKSIDPKAGMQTGRGTLIIDGGSMKRQRNQATVKEFIKLVGGLDQPIVVSPTASQRVTDAEWAEYSDAWGKTIGFKHVSFMHAANHDPAEANTDAFVQDLKKARGLFMRGGRQWRLVNAYGNADNQTTALKEMWKLLERGGVIAGTSAGATVQGDFMPRGFTGGSGRMISRKAEHRRGFAFLLNVAFDVHVSERTRTTDLHQVLAYANERGQDLLGIGIDESTAIAVQGKVFRVIGSGRVFVHTFVEADEGNHVLILRSGDRYNLSTRENFVAAQHLD